MSKEGSALLLEALDSMITQYHMDIVQVNLVKGCTSSLGIAPRNRETPADNSCPLARLLSGDRTLPVYQEDVDTIKQRISGWGDKSSQNLFTLMIHDMQTEKSYQEMKKTLKGKNKITHEFQTSTVLATKAYSSAFKWQNLAPIGIGDLKLFETCKGAVLRGTLISVPSVVKGVTTFLQDHSKGDIIQIALYNYVPGKMSRLDEIEYVRKHLPKGTRVEIAEPFTKIFLDGNRGVRIDNPREFRVEGANGDIATARTEGNEFFKQKMYLAASESYITGLQDENIVPTLLSNRSQAYIKLGQWSQALADAAASLTIRPSCPKTYQRYRKCLAEIIGEHGSNKSDMLNLIIDPMTWNKEHDGSTSESANCLKQSGNEAFKSQDYERAVALYTSGLLAANKDVRLVLSNWSQASLLYQSYHEALAASAASLRVWADDKAVYRLCIALAYLNEIGLAESILDSYDRSAALKDLKSRLKRYKNVIIEDDPGMALLLNSPNSMFCPDFASNKIESFLDPLKGRGIRATDAIPKGSLVLIESPLASSYANEKEEMSISHTFDRNRMVNDKSQSLLESTIMNQMKRNQLLAQRIDNLYDGHASRPLLSVKDLLTTIGVANSPLLLPPWPEFFVNKAPALAAERVRNIMSTNSFGGFDEEELLNGQVTKKETLLYAAISMLNHSFNPNCVIQSYSGSSRAIVTCKTVKKGDELCIRYHSDPEVMKRKWGIVKE